MKEFEKWYETFETRYEMKYKYLFVVLKPNW